MTDAYTESHKIAAHADPNGGKTHQIRYLIREYGHENVGIVSGEHGLGTIRGDVKEEQVFEVTSPETANRAFEWAKENYMRPGAWICIDGGSGIMQMFANNHFNRADKAMECIVLKGVESLPKELKIYQRFVTCNKGVWNVDMMAIYGLLGRQAERFWGAWSRAPWSLYANFWTEKVGQGDRERTLPWGPDCPGRMGLAAIRGAFDYIIKLEANNGGFDAIVRDDPRVTVTKMREDKDLGIDIPDTIKDFNIVEFVKALTPKGDSA